jgi:ABC-type transport system involved in multi-copper enzyme maturation permease subunit
MRWGLGPVFYCEWLITARRWQTYALRSGFVALLLVVLLLTWNSVVARWGDVPPRQAAADVGAYFFYAIVTTQLAAVLLAAPAATAGSICLDRVRGTLTHLLVTDLSSAEVVLGKLAARLVPVLGLVGCSLPVLALTSLLGGVDLLALAGAYAVILGVAVLGCTLALFWSVFGRKTHEVLLLNYLFWIAALLAWPVTSFCEWSMARSSWFADLVARGNPFWLAFDRYSPVPKTHPVEPGIFLLACLALSALLVVVTVAVLRRAVLHERGRARVRARRAAARPLRLPFTPTLDGNPVLWREWHRRRPSWWMWAAWVVYVVAAVVFSGLAVIMGFSGSRDGVELGILVNGLLVAVGLLFLSITSVTCLADERTQGSLDVLMTTPLTTAQIIWGKWWGAYRTVPLLALLSTLTACALVAGQWEHPAVGLPAGHDPSFLTALLLFPLTLAYGAVVTSVGLGLATWVARFGRALAVSVGSYVAFAVGYVFLVMLLFARSEVLAPGLAMGSPLFGPAYLTAAAVEPFHDMEYAPLAAAVWVVVLAAATAVLLGTIHATFEHCLGRVRAAARPPLPARPVRPVRPEPVR